MASSEEVRKVLIALDGSEYAQNAFDSLEIPDFATLTNLYAEEEQLVKTFEEKMTSLLRQRNAKGKVVASAGRPSEVILKVACEENVDFIITGSRGLGTIRRTLLGSVSNNVMHHSPVPVIVCKH